MMIMMILLPTYIMKFKVLAASTQQNHSTAVCINDSVLSYIDTELCRPYPSYFHVPFSTLHSFYLQFPL